jgi:hypothetical protein
MDSDVDVPSTWIERDGRDRRSLRHVEEAAGIRLSGTYRPDQAEGSPSGRSSDNSRIPACPGGNPRRSLRGYREALRLIYDQYVARSDTR